MNEYAQCRLWSPLESCSASTRLENHRQSTRRVLSLLVVSAHVRALFPASSISVCLAQSKHFLHNLAHGAIWCTLLACPKREGFLALTHEHDEIDNKKVE